MKPYSMQKLREALEVARVAADMTLGAYGCGPDDPGRSTVFSADMKKLIAALDALAPGNFNDMLDGIDPMARVLRAVETEEARR